MALPSDEFDGCSSSSFLNDYNDGSMFPDQVPESTSNPQSLSTPHIFINESYQSRPLNATPTGRTRIPPEVRAKCLEMLGDQQKITNIAKALGIKRESIYAIKRKAIKDHLTIGRGRKDRRVHPDRDQLVQMVWFFLFIEANLKPAELTRLIGCKGVKIGNKSIPPLMAGTHYSLKFYAIRHEVLDTLSPGSTETLESSLELFNSISESKDLLFASCKRLRLTIRTLPQTTLPTSPPPGKLFDYVLFFICDGKKILFTKIVYYKLLMPSTTNLFAEGIKSLPIDKQCKIVIDDSFPDTLMFKKKQKT